MKFDRNRSGGPVTCQCGIVYQVIEKYLCSETGEAVAQA
jgi:hypothetical protein